MEPIALHDGRVMQVHDRHTCIGPNCCIHNPSDHPLRDAPLFWDGPNYTMWRRCLHGYIHPDPDDLRVKPALLGIATGLAIIEAITSVHLMQELCDGCCREGNSR